MTIICAVKDAGRVFIGSDTLCESGDMFVTDLLRETDAELSDETVKVEIKVRRKGR